MIFGSKGGVSSHLKDVKGGNGKEEKKGIKESFKNNYRRSQ